MRIEEIEQILIGKELTKESINSNEEPLKNIINDAIGKRWSSAYKLPVFVNMTKDALTEIIEQRGYLLPTYRSSLASVASKASALKTRLSFQDSQ